jgi:hypothetical protein
MNVNPAPGAPSPSRRCAQAVRRAGTLLAAALFATSAQSVAQEPIAAVWQPRNLSFSYSSTRNQFSCRELAGRVAGILRVLGARDDIKVNASGCSDSIQPTPVHGSSSTDRRTMTMGGWDPISERTAAQAAPGAGRQHVNIYVQLMLPTEITPAVLEELEKDKSRRELVARVTGNPAARFNEPVKFRANWQPVTLSQSTVGVTLEECELLDQMSPRVFRELGMRVVRSRLTCESSSLLPPEMVVEALLPATYSSSPEAPATETEEETEKEEEKTEDGQ